MANEFVARKGLISSGSINVSGSITASFISGAHTGTFPYSGLTNVPTLVSSSSQIDYNSITNKLSGVVSSSAQFNALTGTSASFAATASYVNTLLQTVSASGNIEATVNLVSNNSIADEGGQLELARPQTNNSISGSVVIDVFQNRLRIYEKASPNRGGYWDITALSASVATNLLTGGGGGAVTSYTNATDNYVITSTGTGGITGESALLFDGAVLSVTTNGAKYFQGGDDAALYDVNVANTLGVYGVQDSTVGAIKLGSGGKTVYSNATGVGIGTTSPAAFLHVQGNVSASSFTGSLAYSSLAGVPGGLVSSSAQYPGWVTASSQIDYNSITNKLSGVISSSAQFNALTNTSATSASFVTSTIGLGQPTVINSTDGSGLVLQGKGNSQTAELRIVANGGAWLDSINTAYFQITSSTGNNASFMGGKYGADAPFDRLQFNAKYLQISNNGYSSSPVPSYVLQVLNTTSSVVPVVGILGNSTQTSNYLDITTSGSAAGNILSVKGTGLVTIGSNLSVGTSVTASIVSASSITGSFRGDGSQLTNISSAGLPGGVVSSSAQYPGWVTSSTQIVWSSVNYNTGIVSSSAQVQPLLPDGTVSSSTQFKTLTDPFTGSFTGSHTGTFPYSGLTGTPTLVSASSQIDYNSIQNKLSGVVSSSAQVQPLLPGGTVSSSTQTIENLPTGTVSSSNQVIVQNTTGIGALATTGSNIFTANQIITGSLFISQNLVVQGSSSISYISQSTLNIGTNKITVNTDSPSVRFGGLDVIDSGSSPQRSGSLYFDSLNDQWIFVHQNTVGGTTSSVLLMGPPTFNNIGNETLLTQDRLLKGAGLEHVTDSQITDNGITVSITNGLSVGTNLTASQADITTLRATAITASVSGALTGTFPYTGLTGLPTLVSESSQIDYNNIQNKLSGVISSSTQFNALTGTSASFATTASAATSITFVPTSASYALTASFALNSTGGGALSSSVVTEKYTFIGDGATTVYQVSKSYSDPSVFITVGGAAYISPDDYSISASTITFTEAPQSSSNISVKALMNVAQNATGSYSGSFTGDGRGLFNISAPVQVDTYTFDGNGSTQIFNLSSSYNTNALMVSVDGMVYSVPQDYSYAGTAVTFVDAPGSGSNILVKAWVNVSNATGSYSGSFKGDGSGLTNIPVSMTVDSYQYVGDGVTVNYNLSRLYSPSSLLVSVAGLQYADTTDYTYSGFTVSFLTPPPSGSNILIRSYVNSTSQATGSFSGSFIGNFNIVTSSVTLAQTASYVTASAGDSVKVGNVVYGGTNQQFGTGSGFNFFTPTGNGAAYYLIINGKDVADGTSPNNSFMDVMIFQNQASPVYNVITSTTTKGSPGARTYSTSAGSVRIAIASGTNWYVDTATTKFGS